MANKARKDNKNAIIGGVCAAIVVVVIIVVAVVLATRANQLNDGYFVSDGSKYVLTIENEVTDDEQNGAVNPVKTHIVYTYSGDQITGLKTYGEFKDGDTAQKAFNAIKDAGEDMSKYVVDGKYIIVTATEDQYKDMTASDVKAQIEFMENLKNQNQNQNTNTTDQNTSGETQSTEAQSTEAQPANNN